MWKYPPVTVLLQVSFEAPREGGNKADSGFSESMNFRYRPAAAILLATSTREYHTVSLPSIEQTGKRA